MSSISTAKLHFAKCKTTLVWYHTDKNKGYSLKMYRLFHISETVSDKVRTVFKKKYTAASVVPVLKPNSC